MHRGAREEALCSAWKGDVLFFLYYLLGKELQIEPWLPSKGEKAAIEIRPEIEKRREEKKGEGSTICAPVVKKKGKGVYSKSPGDLLLGKKSG